ncbi:hypothetical protein [Polaromonas sp. DSP2-3-2b2]|uniref:hypothetical protein n=1 Tax=Polaromonas sp. DSP2-3-2b2 TaxID=2804662 RepID=UPI003CFBB209
MKSARQLGSVACGAWYTTQQWHYGFAYEVIAGVPVIVGAFSVELTAISRHQCKADEVGLGEIGVKKN